MHVTRLSLEAVQGHTACRRGLLLSISYKTDVLQGPGQHSAPALLTACGLTQAGPGAAAAQAAAPAWPACGRVLPLLAASLGHLLLQLLGGH